uniref:PARP catalytic domain-containing protein n=1 Tax=Labrus bergylta TaxID=56723 RepID=A0A3Q3EPF3_9LABR
KGNQPEIVMRYVMYHGTTSQAARSIMATGFQQSAGGMLGPGVYLSRVLDKASRYPIKHPEHDRVVIKVVVNVGRVIVFDTAWVPPRCGMVSSGLEEDCVWDPNRIQIISAIKPRPRQPSAGYGAYGYM